jgi:hypothetical protein
MARGREKTPTAGDLREVASGKGSASDKREAGYVKRGGRLRAGKRTGRMAQKFHVRLISRGQTGGTKRSR